jgi:2,3-dihydroxybenzoate decarboxylase
MGPDRVLYAMDYPYQYAPEEVGILEGLDMAPQVRQAFFQDNAERLFKIPPAAKTA